MPFFVLLYLAWRCRLSEEHVCPNLLFAWTELDDVLVGRQLYFPTHELLGDVPNDAWVTAEWAEDVDYI